MQKIFQKYMIMIITSAILAILLIITAFSLHSALMQQKQTFSVKLTQIQNTMESNRENIAALNDELGQEYLTRAKAAAYVIQKDPSVLTDTAELQHLSDLLAVDELHIINPDGILQYSSVPKYIGLDFHDDKQTLPFLSILTDSADVIQDTMPNAAEQKQMKYVGTARLDTAGIVQVGISPVRLLEAQEQNTYASVFSSFPTDIGETFFAVNTDSGALLGHSCENTSPDFSADTLSGCTDGSLVRNTDGKLCYVYALESGDDLICASIHASELFSTVIRNILIVAVCLLFVEFLVCAMLNYLIRRRVVTGIHAILDDLSQITRGNLDTTVCVSGSPEFETLSSHINTMVRSICNSSDQIAKIIAMSQLPIVVFEYQKETNHLFVTSGLKKMLRLEESEVDRLFENPSQFYQQILSLMKKTADADQEIYEIDPQHFVQVHMSPQPSGYLGVLTDVSHEMSERRRMQYESTHDQLTGLYHYQDFKEQIQVLISDMPAGRLAACVMMDLDYFKEINDNYGHDFGDVYLRHFADILRQLPSTDYVVARRSGDEFCFFTYYYTKPEQLAVHVRSFWDLVKENPLEFPDHSMRCIRFSGGYSWTSHSDCDPNILMNEADQALYRVKQSEKGTVASFRS